MKKAPAIKLAFRYFLFFFSLLFLQTSIAQNIDFNAGCPNGSIGLTNQVAGQAVSGIPTITAVNSPGGAPFTMTIPTIDVESGGFSTGEGCNACVSPVNIHGLVFTASGANVTITGTPDAASVGYHYSITLTATPNPGSPCSRTYTFDILRKPIDVMLILDNSGSMGASIGGTDTRWTKLKSGVAQFLANYQPQLLTTGGANGDQMGIRMFNSTDAHPVNAPFNVDNFIPVTPSTNTFNILDGDAPGGSTAMGAGLLTGKNFLFPGGADNGHKKAMLLFTDGEQNVPPLVVAAPGSNPTISGTDITNGDKIQIHTIGLGIAGSASQTLYYIAHESGVAPQIGITNIANDLATTPPDLNLLSYLTSISNRLLLGSTPQYVDVRRNRFKAIGESFGAVETFAVSKNIDKIFVNFIAAVTNEARVAGIEKDGQSLNLYDTSIIKSKQGSGWQTFVISVSSIKKKIPSFKSEGNWKVTVFTGTHSAQPYILSLTVDDHNTEMIGATTQTKELVVGDKLPLSIQLTKRGQPLTGATAIAIVGKPGEDLGDTLARIKLNMQFDTSADADNIASQKLKQLLKDSAFMKALLNSDHVVNLTYNAAQKKYVGEFNNLDVSGVYQVVYMVSANDADFGQIKRYAEESVYIRFPDIDLDQSGVNLVVGTNNISTLTIRPLANNGRFVGPGWGNAITLDNKDLKITKVVDNGDGTYNLTIQGDVSNDVTLSIGGAKIYKGKLGDIGKGGGGESGNEPWWKKIWLWILALIALIVGLFRKKKKKTP